jgi:hypothetical protein
MVAALFILATIPYFSSVPTVQFYPPIFLPILARLRNDQKIAALMRRAQESYKADPKTPQSKSPLTEEETKQIQAAIEKIYSETVQSIKTEMQKISDNKKSIIHFRIETDMQLAPGLPFWIDLIFTPTKNLNKDEASYVKSYADTLLEVQNAFKTIMESIAKEIPIQSSQAPAQEKKK